MIWQDWREREREKRGRRGVETGGGDSSETGSVTEEGNKNQSQCQVQPHPTLQDDEDSNNP